MTQNPNQINPKVFSDRILFIFCAILLVQFIHLNLVAVFSFINLLTWIGIAGFGFSLLKLTNRRIDGATGWPKLNSQIFSALFLTSFFVVFTFSRHSYIISFFVKGMYLTRGSEEVGQGGVYSAITILFYPLCIILAFIDIPRVRYYCYSVLMLCIMAIDLVIIGTRGVPVFVFLFHLAMSRVNFRSLKTILGILFLTFIFLVLFDYQTKARSLDSSTVGWDWSEALKYSWLMDILKINDATILLVSEYTSFLLPLIFFMQYLSHSIAEFAQLLGDGRYGLMGSGLYIFDQFCIVAGGDRSALKTLIEEMNPRAGLYQTLYSSLLFDFGFLGILLCFFVIFAYYLASSRKFVELNAFTIYVVVLIDVSSIENYIYNGLGLSRFCVFLILYKLLDVRFLKGLFATTRDKVV